MNERFEAILTQFANSVMEQNAAIERHDQTTGNEFARKYIEASNVLLNAGSGGLDAFAALLNDERDAVRVMAASCLLPHRTSQALPILRAAATGRGITAFGAMMTLKRWKEEEWR